MKIEERVWVEDHILKVYRENPVINCLETFRIKFAEGTEAILIDAETHEAERAELTRLRELDDSNMVTVDADDRANQTAELFKLHARKAHS